METHDIPSEDFFYCEGDLILKQIDQRACGVSIPGDFQNSARPTLGQLDDLKRPLPIPLILWLGDYRSVYPLLSTYREAFFVAHIIKESNTIFPEILSTLWTNTNKRLLSIKLSITNRLQVNFSKEDHILKIRRKFWGRNKQSKGE